jgi:hypothetical protein
MVKRRSTTRKQKKATPIPNTEPHITVFAVEERTQIAPGAPPTTIHREVELRNGIGRKTVRVTRGNRVVSDVTRKLNFSERKRISRRKYIRGLYKPLERETLRNLN